MKKNVASIRPKSSVLSRTRKMAMMASALIPTLWLGLEQPGHAAGVLIHDYQFNGDFADSLAGPALVPLNGTGTLSLTNYSFAAGQGLSLSSGLPSAGNYSIVADFSFASTSGYRKIVDFKTQTSDTGLYNFNTTLNFFNVVTGPAGAFAANVTASMALTRDGTTNLVTGYVNGVQHITFTDGTSLAVFTGANSEIRFFIDDNPTGGSEASAGVVDRIRIYDGALTAAQVNSPIPPATHWLGSTNGTWTGANWASDAAGTPTTAIPTSTDDVTFSATGAANQGSTTLGQDFTIHSLTINDSMPVGIGSGLGGPFKLTISGNAGTGITVNTGANLTISSNVTLAGSSNTIAVNGSGAAAISGVLASTNLLTKTGTGTLTLTGANTFSGGMNLQQGMVSFANGSLGTTGTVEFTGSATLQWNGANTQDISSRLYLEDGVNATFDTNGNNVTLANAFQLGENEPTGTAAITKTGDGTLAMLAVNTYTGGTFIHQGTLSFASGALGTTGTVDFTGSSTLQWNGHSDDISARLKIEDGVNATFDTNGNNVTFGSAFQLGATGSAAVTKDGAGILTIRGVNTYTGTTTVSAGILRAGVSNAGGVGTTGPGAFGNNSAVTVNNTGILQLGGNDVGIGSLAGDANGIVENGEGRFAKRQSSQIVAQSAPATLTTGGNNTDTTFAGTIRDGVGQENVRRPAGEKAAAPLSGPLAIYKTGTGTQTLSGNNSYTGGTTLAQGTLAAGSMKAFGNGNLTVTGGTLKTTGGPLAVDIGAGNILFTGGTYQAGVGGLLPAVQHDQLVTTGMANIGGGTLALVQLNNFHLIAGNRIILLAAAAGVAGGSANGTPVPGSHVTGLAAFSNTPLLVPVVNLYTTSVVLEAMQGSFVLSGLTPNQIAVAQALNSLAAVIGGKTGVIKELDFLDNQSLARLPAYLDMISPEEITLIFQLAKSLANVQSANIQGRLAEIRAELDQIVSINSVNISIGGSCTVNRQAPPLNDERWGLWMIGSGEFTRVGSTSNAAGFDLDSGGVTAGVDYRFSEHFVAGISFGYMNTTASIANGGKVDVNGGRVGAYATWFDRGFYVDASVSGGPNSYNTRRTTPNNTTATANPGGTEVNLLLASGYDWKKGALTFGPIASFQYTNVQLDGFTETGGFAPLSVIRKNADSMRSAIGVRASYDIKVRHAIIRPEARVSWQHEFGDTSYSLTSSFATLGGNPFTVAGPETGRDSMLIRAGVSVQWNDRFSTSAYYDGELLRKNYSSNNVSLGFRWKF